MEFTISKKRPMIYIVDDEPILLETFSDLLGDQYDTQTFVSPKDFLSHINVPNPVEPDLLISDFLMPGISGTEMISRAMEKGMVFPSILLSGNLDKDTVIQAVNLGVYKVFEKPIRTDTLMGAIDQLLLEQEISRARNEIRKITAQLREVYTSFRLIAESHLDAEATQNLRSIVSEGISTKIKDGEKLSFDELIDSLEMRLESLLNHELLLQEMRSMPARAAA